MDFRWDWLDQHLNNPKYNEVFVGYTSYSRKKVTSVNNGVFIGYRKGRPFFWMKFREGVAKQKLGQDIWSHHKSLIGLFNVVYPYISAPPLILLSSKKAVEWLKTSAYKWLSISDKDKSKLYFWVDSLKPEFQHYDITTQPFSVLREYCLTEGNRISKKVVDKSFYDYSKFDEDNKITVE